LCESDQHREPAQFAEGREVKFDDGDAIDLLELREGDIARGSPSAVSLDAVFAARHGRRTQVRLRRDLASKSPPAPEL
jgi:hypothetical protein